MSFPDCLIVLSLIVAIISLWFSGRAWIPLLLLSLGISFYSGHVTLLSIPFIGVGFLIALGIQWLNQRQVAQSCTVIRPRSFKVWLWLLHLLLITWITCLLTHNIPYLNNIILLKNVSVGIGGIPFTLYVNIDKPMAIFALFIAVPSLLGSGITNSHYSKTSWLIIIFGLAGIMLMACLIGLVRPAFKIPSWWWLFALNNLLITCVVEAAIFRGYLQQFLGKYIGFLPALMVSSTLFGVLSYSGGVYYAGLVLLAGLVYGFAFHISGRLWVSIMIQFLLNFIHLIFFTYPILA